MNRGLRFVGLGGAALVVFWVGLNMFHHARAAALVSHSADPGPPGFLQKLRGVGVFEIAFRGPINLVAEKRVPQDHGTTLFVPRFRVVGDDPKPLADGVAMSAVVIDSLDAEPGRTTRTAFTVVAPEAWMPLDESADRFTFDMEKLWHLDVAL